VICLAPISTFIQPRCRRVEMAYARDFGQLGNELSFCCHRLELMEIAENTFRFFGRKTERNGNINRSRGAAPRIRYRSDSENSYLWHLGA